jgi:GNAT superfamily N-acetyltransferase
MTDDSTIRIRAFEAADHDAWLPLWRGYQTFYKVDIPAATSEVTWGRILDPAEPMFGALAFSGNTAVGMVHWLFHRSTWTVGNYCYLQDLFVANSQRGGGVGRKLIEHVYDVARAADCSRVYWLTHETNAAAMVLYNSIADRSGFLQYRKLLS